MGSQRIIGIDLGTSYSSVSVIVNNKPVIIPSRDGYNTIPSIVSFTPDGEILTGYRAKRYLLIDPQNSIVGFKRLVGRRYRSKVVQDILKYFKYNIVEDKNGGCAVEVYGTVMSLEQITSILLKELREMASQYLNEDITRALITVPAFYNESQRIAVKRAGELAGLKVERILNEPTAAAIAFGFDRRLSRRVFVYDFGGGTFDISILNIDNDTFEVEATGGDTFLGGIDFDRRLMDIILERFEKKEGKSLRGDKVAIQRIFDACEIAKIELSSATESRVIIPAITVIRNSSVSISEKITRDEFEDRVRDLVDRSLMLCDATLSEIQMGREDIDDVVLVGGQTRMPLIRRQIRDFFSKEPLYKVNPSEAVAIGAAIVADSIYRQSKIDFKDVLPQSIGFSPDGKRYIRIVPKNSRLPVKKEFIMLNNRDNSTEMDVVIYQGDSPYIEANEILGVLSIRGITPALKNFIKIKVTIEIDSESILRFSAVELPDERRLETVFEKYNIDMMYTDTTILDI
jgi:molecular chaperone DnaK